MCYLRERRRIRSEWLVTVEDKFFVFLVCVLGFLLVMIVLSWNVRGLGMGEKRRMVNGVVNMNKPGIIFI
jgi:hypothetical protein